MDAWRSSKGRSQTVLSPGHSGQRACRSALPQPRIHGRLSLLVPRQAGDPLMQTLYEFLVGEYRKLSRPIWVIFCIQVILRGGDFVFPFMTMFLTRKLGLSSAAAGLWIMGNVASGLLGTLIAGKFSDHLGWKRVLATAMIGTG